MAEEQVTNDRRALIRLEGPLTIAGARELKERLLAALVAGLPAVVDLKDVTAIDVTGFQLLWAAFRDARAAGIDWVLSGVPAHDAIAMLSTAGLFLPVDAKGELRA